jgi:hypothetical protein
VESKAAHCSSLRTVVALAGFSQTTPHNFARDVILVSPGHGVASVAHGDFHQDLSFFHRSTLRVNSLSMVYGMMIPIDFELVVTAQAAGKLL